MKDRKVAKYLKKMKKSRAFKVGSVAASFFITIASEAKSFKNLLDELGESEYMSFFRYPTWHPEMRGRKYYSRSQLTRGLSTLERGGYTKRKGRQTVFLTKKGIQEILKFKMRNKHLEGGWDGKWRIIVFDIEEITRKDRNYLRLQLKWIGFQELQESVWVYPYEIRDELKEFIKLCKFKFQGDVRFILAEKIEPDFSIRKKFDFA